MKISNFAILNGEAARVANGVISYTPKTKGKPKTAGSIEPPEPVDIRSDCIFRSGTISFKFTCSDAETGVLAVLGAQGIDESSILVGHSRNRKAFTIWHDRTDNLVVAGSLKNYDLKAPFYVRIEVAGSNVRLFVNEVKLIEKLMPIKEAPLTFRIASGDYVEISDVEVNQSRPKAFVVIQFSDEYNTLYEEVIKPVCTAHNLDVVRADDFHTSTPILKDIIDSINEASLIIAEITPDNPNVFYEIGYSHALNKPTILLCAKTREKLPFDLSSFRTLFYENTIAGKSRVEVALRQYLESML